jgi:hypothetical protein
LHIPESRPDEITKEGSQHIKRPMGQVDDRHNAEDQSQTQGYHEQNQPIGRSAYKLVYKCDKDHLKAFTALEGRSFLGFLAEIHSLFAASGNRHGINGLSGFKDYKAVLRFKDQRADVFG